MIFQRAVSVKNVLDILPLVPRSAVNFRIRFPSCFFIILLRDYQFMCLPNIRAVLRVPADSLTIRFCELRPRIFRSPSDVDTLGRASVLRDGAAFRPASAPHPLLLENHFYQPFTHPSETPLHSHTAPHTPTELEQQLERARSEERNNCDLKESVAEGEIDLRRSKSWSKDPTGRSRRQRSWSRVRRSSNKTGANGVDRSGENGEVGGKIVEAG